MSDGRYELKELVAVQWSPEMAAQFPSARHTHCRQEMRVVDGRWEALSPPKCHDYHCPQCGEATNLYGHHSPK